MRPARITELRHPCQHDGGAVHGGVLSRIAVMGACLHARLQAAGVLAQTGLPNCYTLTKRMAEELVAGMHGAAFPVALVRPTIIGAVARAPLPGYFGNAAGITAATLAFASGAHAPTCHCRNMHLAAG